jgi:hypothetical protein
VRKLLLDLRPHLQRVQSPRSLLRRWPLAHDSSLRCALLAPRSTPYLQPPSIKKK